MKKLKDELNTAPLRDHPNTLKAFQKELEEILHFSDTFARLESELNLFEERLNNAKKSNEFIDKKVALNLYVIACALFRICQKAPFEKFVPFALAAISYFAEAKDGKNDFEDIDGFEDDQIVINLIINYFQLEEKIEVEVLQMKASKETQSA